MSSGGDFAHGFGLCPDAHKPAVLWFANHLLDPAGTQRYDTLSYPHRAAYAFVNWPVGLAERNPAEILPRYYYDKRARYLVVRTGWAGNSDIVLTMRAGTGLAAGAGLGRVGFTAFPEAPRSVTASADGSVITINFSDSVMLVDVSGKSGAPVVLLNADKHRVPGRAATTAAVLRPVSTTSAPVKPVKKKGGDDDEPEEVVVLEGDAANEPPVQMTGAEQWVNGYFYNITVFKSGEPAIIAIDGTGVDQKLKIGDRTYWCDGKVIQTSP
jgi:hypothetical protein